MAVPDELTLTFIEILALFFGASGCILIKLDHQQPKPYMDEIFHIPQAQKYCNGQFLQWDPMITTLPGLYISSLLTSKPISWLFGVPIKMACSTFWLRSINIAFAVGNLCMLVLLTKQIHGSSKKYDPTRALWNAVTLSIFPLLYFFTFLYYTDPGSTFFTLLMYLLSLRKRQLAAAGAGVVAVLFRQTNIVWVVFVGGQVVAEKIVEFVRPEKKDIKEETVQGFEFLPILFRQLMSNWKLTFQLVRTVVKSTFCYILVGVGFLVFVIVNGSIVVGAKDDHQAGLHFPQVYYFLAFTGVFSFMHFVTLQKIKGFLKFFYKHPIQVFIFGLVSFVLIWKFTFAHKYLLADNRHYTFYVWAKVFRRHDLIKFALIPGYLFVFWNMCDSLKHRTILWKLVFALCIVVNLVPSMLMEFRYFILPYLIFRLQISIPSYKQIVLELAFYIVINFATLYAFMYKPFQWENETSLQRFMW